MQTQEHPAGKAPSSLPKCVFVGCPWSPIRFFSAESLPQIGADPFRAYHLSPRKEFAQVTQQRYVDAPEDRGEARVIEKSRGIKYVGDDTSGMTAPAQRAVETYKTKKRDGQTV